tara:strand:- start:632 stop:997 length:366 start_codon:yes stop_codon:yes gene_type:complete
MDKNLHYPVADIKQNGLKNSGWEVISINNIILDRGMNQLAKEKCDDNCKGKGLRKRINGPIIPMVKWKKVFLDFENKKALDPIIISKYRNTKYYDIIDGRHRCMLSHYNGYTHVPCIILNV